MNQVPAWSRCLGGGLPPRPGRQDQAGTRLSEAELMAGLVCSGCAGVKIPHGRAGLAGREVVNTEPY